MEYHSHVSLSGHISRCGACLTRPAIRLLVGAAGIVLLTWAGADVRIPLQPVPITLQTLFVLLAGALVGSGAGSLSQAAYLGLGIAGVPVFAGSSAGLAVLAGPTGGYLLGFVVAPFIVGRWIGTGENHFRTLAVFAAAALVILVTGVAHLALVYTHDFWAAVRFGLLPFLPGDALKVLTAASIFGAYRRLTS